MQAAEMIANNENTVRWIKKSSCEGELIMLWLTPDNLPQCAAAAWQFFKLTSTLSLLTIKVTAVTATSTFLLSNGKYRVYSDNGYSLITWNS